MTERILTFDEFNEMAQGDLTADPNILEVGLKDMYVRGAARRRLFANTPQGLDNYRYQVSERLREIGIDEAYDETIFDIAESIARREYEANRVW